MQGTFELNKPGYYTVQNSTPNEFLNNLLENKDYGIWYSVKFTGDAATFLWRTKSEPVENKTYYGHLETTRSGKSTTFKTDKAPEDIQPATSASTSSTFHQRDDKAYQDGQAWGNALTNAVVTVQTFSVTKSYASLQAMREDIVETAHYYFNARNEKPVAEPPLTDIDIPVEFRR